MNNPIARTWTLVCHLTHEGRGSAAVVTGTSQGITARAVPLAPATGLAFGYRPVFIGLMEGEGVVLLDPVSQQLGIAPALAVDAVPLYAYPGAEQGEWWYVNDGDDDGNDAAVCGGKGSQIMVLRHGPGTGEVVKTLCVGRGHHVVAFSAAPRQAFVSNLLDGNIVVLGFDASDKATYLQPVTTINLFDASKEKEGTGPVPNNAFPHGMVYSAVTGKVYNLNNGYSTVVAIDPKTNTAEVTGVMKGSSNLLLSPCGRYLIGKGADRKANPEHVLGRLCVMDVLSNSVVTVEDISDFYPSTYRFNAEGTKLYVTSAATGKGAQKDHLKIDVVRIYDATALPALKLLRTVQVGKADCSRRPFVFLAESGKTRYVFIPNPTDGTLSVLDGTSDTVVQTVTVGAGGADEVNFSYWGTPVHGC